jgi:hypothetical protein
VFGLGKKKLFLDDELQSKYENLSFGDRGRIETLADEIHFTVHQQAQVMGMGVGAALFEDVFCNYQGVYGFSQPDMMVVDVEELPFAFRLKNLKSAKKLFLDNPPAGLGSPGAGYEFNSGLSHMSLEVALWVLLGRNDFRGIKSASNNYTTPEETEHGFGTIRCKECNQALNVPLTRKLKITCPTCKHSWISDG